MGEIFISLFAAAVILFPIYIVSAQLSMGTKKQERAMKKAVERGHVVTAHFVKSYMASRDNPRRGIDQHGQALYEYEYNGKRYRYTALTDDPPATLQLYFLTDPRKASVEGSVELSKFPWPAAYLLLALCAYLIVRS